MIATVPLSKRLKKTAVPSIFLLVDPANPAEIARGDRAKARGVKRKLIADISLTVPEQVLFYDECYIAEEIVFESFDILKNSRTSESVNQLAF